MVRDVHLGLVYFLFSCLLPLYLRLVLYDTTTTTTTTIFTPKKKDKSPPLQRPLGYFALFPAQTPVAVTLFPKSRQQVPSREIHTVTPSSRQASNWSCALSSERPLNLQRLN